MDRRFDGSIGWQFREKRIAEAKRVGKLCSRGGTHAGEPVAPLQRRTSGLYGQRNVPDALVGWSAVRLRRAD